MVLLRNKGQALVYIVCRAHSSKSKGRYIDICIYVDVCISIRIEHRLFSPFCQISG